MRMLFVVLAVLLLPGCSMFTEYQALKAVAKEGVETGIQDVKDFSDTEAKVLTNLPCKASLGSVMRLEDERKKAILVELCGGPPADKPMIVVDSNNVITPQPAVP